MAKPYDAAGKELLELAPTGWLELLGVIRSAEKVHVIDADVSAVTAAADKVLRIDDDAPWLFHIEFQTGRDPFLPGRMAMYHAVLHARHRLPVSTVVVLLRPDADGPNLTGAYRVAPPLGPASEFGYTVVRVWELPVERLLTGPVVLTPLAPIAAGSRAEVADVVERMSRRIHAEVDADTFEKLVQATSFLLTMRYDAMTAKTMFVDHPAMKEFYDLIEKDAVLKGRVEGLADEARATVFRLGRKRFGTPPKPEHEAVLRRETELARLEALADRVLDVTTWDALLALPE